MQKQNIRLKPVDILDIHGAADVTNIQGKAPTHTRLLDLKDSIDLNSKEISSNSILNYLRSDDDVSATSYFYLNTAESTLPSLPNVGIRMKDMKEKVFDKELKK